MVTGTYRGAEGRPRLLRRLTWLRNLEWANVPFLGVLLLWWLPAESDLAVPADTWLRTAAFVPVGGLLLVGGWYWHRKLGELRDGRPLDDALPAFDRLDRWSPWLLGAAIVGLVAAATVGVGRVTDRWWAAGLLLFAVAEFVNYFRWQLMHDTASDLERLRATRRLRRSWLHDDPARWRTSPGRPTR